MAPPSATQPTGLRKTRPHVSPRMAGISPGCKDDWGISYRWYRFAQPPANSCDPHRVGCVGVDLKRGETNVHTPNQVPQ